MAAEPKKSELRKREIENLELWSRVEMTDPAHAKKVRKGGREIAAVDTYYRIQRATEVFGPVGRGWGWKIRSVRIEGCVWLCHLTLWWHDEEPAIDLVTGSRPNEYDAVGCTPVNMGRGDKAYPDDEAPKKAVTDAITKGLSYMGFNADIFLGKFEDERYVAHANQEARAAERAKTEAPKTTPKPSAQQSAPRAASGGQDAAGSGKAWQPAELERYPSSKLELPVGAARRASTDAVGPDGQPTWFRETLGFGKHGTSTWQQMTEGSSGGGREQFLLWVVGNMQTRDEKGDWKLGNCVAVARAAAALHWKKKHGVVDAEYDRMAAADSEAGDSFGGAR